MCIKDFFNLKDLSQPSSGGEQALGHVGLGSITKVLFREGVGSFDSQSRGKFLFFFFKKEVASIHVDTSLNTIRHYSSAMLHFVLFVLYFV